MTDNASLIRTFYDHVYSGEIEDILAMLHDDFTWLIGTNSEELAAAIPWAGRVLRGSKGFLEMVDGLFGEFETVEFQARDFVTAGDDVFVEGMFVFRHKETGKTAVSDWLARFRVADGKILGGQFFENTYAVAAARK
ncbi:nuclear transport factor 2 family protein [Flindersiella endophytica]